MRAPYLAIVAALALACTAAAPGGGPTPSPTPHPSGIVAVTALLDLSGARPTSGGHAQRTAFGLWSDIEQARHPSAAIRLKVVDVAGSDAKLLLELRRAAEEDRADAVIIGTPTANGDLLGRALQVAGIPVLTTLPAPPLPTGNGWLFALAPPDEDLGSRAIDDAAARDLLGGAFIVSDESAASVRERQGLETGLAKRGLKPLPLVPLAGDERDVPAKLAPYLAQSRAVFCVGPGAGCDRTVRAAAASASRPTVYLSYATELADVSGFGDAAAIVTWPGARAIVRHQDFLDKFAERSGRASTLAGAAYDALSLIALAAPLAAPGDRFGLRDRLRATTFAGIDTTYSFTRRTGLSGFDPDDVGFQRWRAGRPEWVPPPTKRVG